MNEKDDLAGLRDLYKILGNATAALAGFIKSTKRGKVPTKLLMETADKAVNDLAEWRAKIKEAVAAPELQSDDRERWFNPSKTH